MSEACLDGVNVSADRTNPRRLSVLLGEVLRKGTNSGAITCGRGPEANLQWLHNKSIGQYWQTVMT